MSRIFSTAMHQALYAAETEDAFLILLTLDHSALETPLRVTSDAVVTDSRGQAFMPFPFDLTLPEDFDGRTIGARLVIDNIDRQVVQAVRSITSAPSILIEIVRAAAPNSVEAQFLDFKLAHVVYDVVRVEGLLVIEDFTAEPYPATVFSPSGFPGLF